MSWLGTRILGWRPFGRREEGATAVLEEEGQEGHRAGGAPLMILVPDAGGRSYFRPYAFDDAESAAVFIGFWYPTDPQPPVAAFWALEGQPEAAADAEVVVLIRDPGRPGTVHVFSFLEMELAQSFIRVAAAEGTDLGLVQLYWAVPVKVETNRWGRLEIEPSEPPPAHHRANGAAAARPAVGAAVRPGEEDSGRQPELEIPWREPRSSVPETLVQAPPEEEERWEPPAAPPEPEVKDELPWHTNPAWPEIEQEAEAGAPEAVAEEPPASRPAPDGEGNGRAHDAVTWPELVVEDAGALSPAAIVEEAPLEEATVWEPPAPPEEAEPEGEAAAEATAGEALVEEETPAPPEASTQAESAEKAPETGTPENLDGLLDELSKTLKVRRWEVKEEPFRGFGSPPGKF